MVEVGTFGRPQLPRRVVAFMGFGAWLDDFERHRFEVLSERLDAFVVVPQTPGLGASDSALLGPERRALLRGDFDPLARRLAVAAIEALPDGGTVGVLGYSMGASLAASAAITIPRARLATLTLIEPVGFRGQRPLRLMRAVREEDKQVHHYVQESLDDAKPPARPPKDSPPKRHRLDLAALGVALCRGRSGLALERLASTGADPLVTLCHGTSSILAPPQHVEELVERARAAGLTADHLELPGGHGLWQSLPRVRDLAAQLVLLWDRR